MLPGLLLSLGLVLLPLAPHRPAPLRSMARAGAVVAGLDYKDPTVAAEFATVQSFSTEELEKELADSGIIAPPTMNEVDLRLMLVELRMRKSGTLPGKISKKQKPVRRRATGPAVARAKPPRLGRDGCCRVVAQFAEIGGHRARCLPRRLRVAARAQNRHGWSSLPPDRFSEHSACFRAPGAARPPEQSPEATATGAGYRTRAGAPGLEIYLPPASPRTPAPAVLDTPTRLRE